MSDNKAKKTDRRVLYTKMILRESLLELMREKPIDKITPTELCRRADINRNTFYSHYYTPRDVLDEIEDEFADQLVSEVSEKLGINSTRDLIIDICRIVYDKREFTKILLSENGDTAFLKNAVEQCSEYIIRDWRERGMDIDNAKLDLLFVFVIEGSLSIIRKWADLDFRMTPDDVANLIHTATTGCLSAMIE